MPVVRAAGEIDVDIAVDDRRFALDAEDLERLLLGLRRLDRRDAREVGEQIAALWVAGGVIRLSLRVSELRMVDYALHAPGGEARPMTAPLERFARFCRSHPIAVDR